MRTIHFRLLLTIKGTPSFLYGSSCSGIIKRDAEEKKTSHIKKTNFVVVVRGF